MRNIQEKICVATCTICAAFSIYSIGYANGSTVAHADPIEPTVCVVTEPTQEPTIIPTEPAAIHTEPPTEPSTEPPEFPVAQQIWDFLKSQGFSDSVSAGILGNMMAECGGNTFELNTEIYGGRFYGICQWYDEYFPEVQGKPLEYQLEYLMSTMKSQFGEKINDFLKSDSPEEAAVMFANYYEKCADWAVSVRPENARKAYDYFCSGKKVIQ